MADPNDVQIQVPSEAATTLPPAQDAPTLAAPQLAPAAADGQISVEHAAAPLPDLVKPHAGVKRGGGSGDLFQFLKMTLFSPCKPRSSPFRPTPSPTRSREHQSQRYGRVAGTPTVPLLVLRTLAPSHVSAGHDF